MNYLPIFYRVSGQPCLVIGGGGIAARKVELLLKAEASVRLVAIEIGDTVQQMVNDGLIKCDLRPFAESDLESVICVIAATNDRNLNAQISALAKQRNIPVNVVDRHENWTGDVSSLS